MPIRRALVPLLAAGVTLATLLATSGCSLVADAESADGATTSPTPTASHSTPTPTPPAPEGASPQAHTSTVTVDDVVLQVVAPRAPAVQADEQGPGTRTVTLGLAPGESAQLTLTSPGALDVDSDGSIAVLDGNGTPVAAIGPPAPPSGTEDDSPRIEVSDIDATSAQVEMGVADRANPTAQESGPGESGPTEPLRATFVVGTHAIESATWGENEGGRSLAVDPTDWARHAGEAGLDLIRTQLVAAEPEADSSTMGDQLVCHAVGAPDKSTWNLEPWRPDVGLILAATAHCNPV